MSRLVESTARTNKLFCTDCDAKIKKGDDVVFEIDDGRMLSCYCEVCKENYTRGVLEDSEHPFSPDGHGQD